MKANCTLPIYFWRNWNECATFPKFGKSVAGWLGGS